MRTTTFGAFTMFIFLALIFTTSNAFAQSCNTEIKVTKDRDRRSANELDPTQYQMELINNGNSSQTYQISVSNYDGTFMIKNKRPQVLSASYPINSVIFQNNQQQNTITVPARSTAIFKLAVTVPAGTPVDKWAGLEVQAVSNACPNGSVTKLVKLYISDPTEE
jgi:archaellum component FlaG (FlaF/FlaG flagellin family)